MFTGSHAVGCAKKPAKTISSFPEQILFVG